MIDRTQETWNFISGNVYDSIRKALRKSLPKNREAAIKSGITDGTVISAVLTAAVGFAAELTQKADGNPAIVAAMLRDYADTMEKDPSSLMPSSDTAVLN